LGRCSPFNVSYQHCCKKHKCQWFRPSLVPIGLVLVVSEVSRTYKNLEFRS
jgi:hypothetical protein